MHFLSWFLQARCKYQHNQRARHRANHEEYHSVVIFPVTLWESGDAGRERSAVGCQMHGSVMGGQQVREVRQTETSWSPPAACEGNQSIHLLHHSQGPQRQKVHRACVAGKSRSLVGDGRHCRTEGSRWPTGSSGGKAGTGAELKLRSNNSLSQHPAGRPWAGEWRDSQTAAAEDIHHYTSLTAPSPVHHLDRCRRDHRMTDQPNVCHCSYVIYYCFNGHHAHILYALCVFN